MKRMILFGVFALICALGVGSVSAQRASGPEYRYQTQQPAPVVHNKKGFCYSGRTQTCSSIFARQTEAEISRECANTGWHRFYAYDHGRDAQEMHNQVCRN